ncbi:M20 family metallopeptidase [Polyangium spumosum]|uniref:M20/M25/M40 family metallo-hydrolase n=1 Tax=Polyangium spumosum TaxID=889282 RepID=A0A6N7PFD1_9BACT|nr:M20 family metallopeptidase [Polyangium spumosum]MRG90718.1 M20/M25/M40 family metallo-hydrolase [Polyangium spumosum]
MTTKLDQPQAEAFCERVWEQEILPALTDYIRIPNKSPSFDRAWRENGHMDRAVALIEQWCRAQPVPGLTVEVVRLEGRTPVILMEIPGKSDDTILLYGHLDKQPEMTGWRDGLGPWEPVREGDKLYGRGGADDGYSAFASVAALRLLAEQKLPHARCVVLIEAAEESGSFDLPAYIDALGPRIGKPSLVVCLDSGCGNYEQLWTTTSLRGLVQGSLEVRILREGVHSGSGSGVAASSFRILRQLLSRIEDERTGRILLDELYAVIPEQRIAQAEAAAAVLGDAIYAEMPWAAGAGPMGHDNKDRLLNRTWRPMLSITGIDGVPATSSAGNVLRPFTKAKLSMRIPPRVDPRRAGDALKRALEADPPYGADVTFTVSEPSDGWDAPPLAPWLDAAMQRASQAFFGRPAMAFGEGGTIPFMGMLGEKFPEAQFLITGVLGPQSNAHGPNEFLHIRCGKKLTACVASVIADHFTRGS